MDDTLDALRASFTDCLLTDAPDMAALQALDPRSLIHPGKWLGRRARVARRSADDPNL